MTRYYTFAMLFASNLNESHSYKEYIGNWISSKMAFSKQISHAKFECKKCHENKCYHSKRIDYLFLFCWFSLHSTSIPDLLGNCEMNEW